MSTARPVVNPYAADSAEYILWEHWHKGVFAEPVHAQLYSIEEDLRNAFTILMQTADEIRFPTVRDTMRAQLLKIEAAILLLNESAEHAYQRVVSEPGVPGAEGASGDASEGAPTKKED